MPSSSSTTTPLSTTREAQRPLDSPTRSAVFARDATDRRFSCAADCPTRRCPSVLRWSGGCATVGADLGESFAVGVTAHADDSGVRRRHDNRQPNPRQTRCTSVRAPQRPLERRYAREPLCDSSMTSGTVATADGVDDHHVAVHPTRKGMTDRAMKSHPQIHVADDDRVRLQFLDKPEQHSDRPSRFSTSVNLQGATRRGLPRSRRQPSRAPRPEHRSTTTMGTQPRPLGFPKVRVRAG